MPDPSSFDPLYADPLYLEALRRFHDVRSLARNSGLREPDAMTLATADASGRPMARTVLLRGVDERGFTFFTNSQSRKGRQLAGNPRAALCLYWDALAQQVLIEGAVEIVSAAESDAYFASRARDSQIGAWASLQSQPLDDRATLLRRVAEYDQKYAQGHVPRPPHWHGYRVAPDRIEFWTSKPARLHERVVYEREEQGWVKRLLFP